MPNASQEDIFVEISQLVQSALDGYKVIIFVLALLHSLSLSLCSFLILSNQSIKLLNNDNDMFQCIFLD